MDHETWLEALFSHDTPDRFMAPGAEIPALPPAEEDRPGGAPFLLQGRVGSREFKAGVAFTNRHPMHAGVWRFLTPIGRQQVSRS